MQILSIETSCDETAAAVVKNGSEVLSNVVATQTEFHKKYGGIVPEIASRKHIEVINPVIKEAMDKAGRTFKDLDAVAVTYGPGLVGSLLVGLCAAKALAWALKLPLVGVNHLEGHIYANFVGANPKSQIPNPKFPFVCLIVSGGHTMIVEVKDHGKYEVLGRTRDDAAGEAFDKAARVLGLGYPGGPIIDNLAKEGNPDAVGFKLPMMEEQYGYDFSFSGIKTAVVNLVMSRHVGPGCEMRKENVSASFQRAVVITLVEKLIKAAKDKKVKTVSLAGGVSANSGLRKYLLERCEEEGLEAMIPQFEYSTDNAAMIACAAYYQLTTYNSQLTTNYNLKPVASLKL